tara:strand:- start:56 stop:700 length:645 start_codon:yes stop_codon:yes gene_type:complete
VTQAAARILSAFVVLIFLTGPSACSLLDRRIQSVNSNSSYQPVYNPKTKYALEAKEELGLPNGYLSSYDQQRLNERIYLKELENQLDTRSEKAQYYQLRSSLGSDRERIQFLLLGSREAKARWITMRGLNRQDSHSDEIAKVIESNDLALGMSESAVRESWGDPDVIEVAGNTVYGYERWRYKRIVSGNDGYQQELRSVYFEGGRVVGWETEDM